MKTNVVIIGAGSVGCVAAYYLAQHGLDVVLAEQGPDCAQEVRASTFHPPPLKTNWFERRRVRMGGSMTGDEAALSQAELDRMLWTRDALASRLKIGVIGLSTAGTGSRLCRGKDGQWLNG